MTVATVEAMGAVKFDVWVYRQIPVLMGRKQGH